MYNKGYAKATYTFACRMLDELEKNHNTKGDFLAWTPTEEDLHKEFMYHLEKLDRAILAKDKALVLEFTADLANYLIKYAQVFGGLDV